MFPSKAYQCLEQIISEFTGIFKEEHFNLILTKLCILFLNYQGEFLIPFLGLASHYCERIKSEQVTLDCKETLKMESWQLQISEVISSRAKQISFRQIQLFLPHLPMWWSYRCAPPCLVPKTILLSLFEFVLVLVIFKYKINTYLPNTLIVKNKLAKGILAALFYSQVT